MSSNRTTKRRAEDGKSNTSSPSTENAEELMDAADLDHRMLRKAEAVIQWRTTRLVLVIERCTNDHNYSAILRTAEALGIQIVYMIDPPYVRMEGDDGDVAQFQNKSQRQQQKELSITPEESEARRMHHLFARNATEWLTVKDFATTEECVADLRKEGYQLWVTDLSQAAVCLTTTTNNNSTGQGLQVPDKVALVMGTEAVGCSQFMLDQADLRVYLPLRGYADSLNLSVATALIIHQLFVMDPTLIGGITEDQKRQLRQDWYTKLCQQRLLTSRQKKERVKLMGLIKKCESIQERVHTQTALQQNPLLLQPTEQKRLSEWGAYKEQLADLDALIDPVKVQAAVQEWVDNPPAPLTDVRRADDHRVCYVGKNTKQHHQDHWKDMVATSNVKSIQGSSASAFREKVKQQTAQS
jgi:tRNA G18 (ribose-2'-O)-methylase SpoU